MTEVDRSTGLAIVTKTTSYEDYPVSRGRECHYEWRYTREGPVPSG